MKIKTCCIISAVLMIISVLFSSCAHSADNGVDNSQLTTEFDEDTLNVGDETSEDKTDEETTALEETTDSETTVFVDPNAYLEFNRDDFTLSAYGSWWNLYTGTIPAEVVEFSSENENIASIDVNGRVTGISPGNTVVYAEYNGNKIGCTVRCKWTPNGEVTTIPSKPETEPAQTTDKKPQSNSQSAGFFSDAAFLGDSVSMMLRNRCVNTGDLSGALFLVQGSYGAGHAVNGTMLINYQGQKMSPEDAIAASAVKKVFIMLGMNDLNIYGIDGTIDKWGILTQRIKAKSPDVTIYVQSMSPVLTGAESGKLNNTTIDQYNAKLQAFAASNGFVYIDVASSLKDSSNGLASAYCSDGFVHLSPAGADVWIHVLKEFVRNH